MRFYDALAALDNVKLKFSEGSLLFLNITLAIIMVGVALGVRLKRFKKLFLSPKPVIVGLISQLTLLPALTFLLTIILKLPESISLGMILVACCPGGNMSNFMSSLAKGNVELSVSMTMFTTLGAALLTPLNFSIWGNMFIRFASKRYEEIATVQIDFFQMLQSVIIILVIPLIVGLVITRYFPKFSIKSAPYVKNVSVIIFLTLVCVMIYNNWSFVVSYVKLIFFIVFIHNALALMAGYFSATATKLNKKDRRTVAIETGIQNSGLALVLIFNPKLFNGMGGMATIAAWWGIWHIISGLLIGYYWSKKKIV
ncbi:MAG TPA: bile acid:sodium symporter family protein [Bacteroidetes bacterium]|nr:bile acid:sodium symporter family protein [Bacteroidota bacterium]